jgi:hypothetical protein
VNQSTHLDSKKSGIEQVKELSKWKNIDDNQDINSKAAKRKGVCKLLDLEYLYFGLTGKKT